MDERLNNREAPGRSIPMSNEPLMEKRWKLFAEKCLPPSCSFVQYAETKKAFMCGFSDCFFAMDEITCLSEAEAFIKMDALKDETMKHSLKTLQSMQRDGI